MITGISVHDRVDWVFTITGMRRMASNTRPQRRGDGRQDPVGLLVDALHLRAKQRARPTYSTGTRKTVATG